jgi:nickel-dependent lactate racemase
MTTETRPIRLPYGDDTLEFSPSAGRVLGVFSPHAVEPCADADAEIRRALDAPISSPSLVEAAAGATRVVIVADDLTRLTPVHQIIPHLLNDLNRAGVSDDKITVLIALGTHRPMTDAENLVRFGEEVMRRVTVLNNPWQDPEAMVDLGTTENGTSVSVSRIALEADFIVGLGSIVPHHIPGYSAGAKIIQPGITGSETTGATHLLSTREPRSLLGQLENPVRAEMESIADQVGLKAVFNCVLDSHGELVQAFYGDPKQAFREGAALSRKVYGVALPEPADIVVASSHPCDIEFWQAHKTLYPAEIAVKPGGTIIVVTPCPEGVSVTHQNMLQYTNMASEEVLRLIEDGTLSDVVSGALALAWAKAREHAQVLLVSDGIADAEARALGFTPCASVEDALEAALSKHGPDATISVLTHAPDTLPLLPD